MTATKTRSQMTQMTAGSDEGVGGGWKPNLRGNCFKLHSEVEQERGRSVEEAFSFFCLKIIYTKA